MNRATSAFAGAALLFSGFAYADYLEPPIRARLNPEIVLDILHKGDQRILGMFKDQEVTLEESANQLSNLNFSLLPPEGINEEDYDWTVSLNDEQKGFLGMEALGLRLTGSAQ